MDATEKNKENLTSETIPSQKEVEGTSAKGKKKLEIDKRNLIIYSEIMKPKFKE